MTLTVLLITTPEPQIRFRDFWRYLWPICVNFKQEPYNS